MTDFVEGKGKRVRIYLAEGDLVGHTAAHVAIIEFLRNANCAGATVFRGIEGFGGTGQLHTSRFVDVLFRLPLVVEWIDSAEHVDNLLGRIKEMVTRGLITVEDTQIVLYSPHPLRRVSARLSARDVMSRDVVSVERTAPIAKVVELLLGKLYRAVPVVADGAPVGMITNTDLVNRGGLAVRMELLSTLGSTEQRMELERLANVQKTARDLMTPNPVTVHSAAPLPVVAEVMMRHRLKRLPVTDDAGKLAGIVSRIDVLRSVAEGVTAADTGRPDVNLNGEMTISKVMRQEVPTVLPDTPVGEALQAVISTRLNRAIVVDREKRVVGILSDQELLDRVAPSHRQNVLRSLMHRLPFVRHSQEETAADQHANARVAKDLMSTDMTIVETETPLRQALSTMLRDRQKLIAVVDKDKRLVGIVDRADILRGLAQPL